MSVHSPRRKRMLPALRKGAAVFALMHQFEALDGEAEHRMLGVVAEIGPAAQPVEFLRLLHVLDGVGEVGDALGIGVQRGDRRHHMDKPGTLADQRIHQFGARYIALEVDLFVHIGQQAGAVGDNPRRDEIVDRLERHVAGIDPVQASPGAIDTDVKPIVHFLLDVLATSGGDMEAAAQQGGQFGAIAAFGLLDGDGQPLQDAAELHGDKRVYRHVERDRREGEHGAAIVAEKLQPGHRRSRSRAASGRRRYNDVATPITPMARPIAPPVMPLDRILDALVDVVGRFGDRPSLPLCRVLHVEMRVIAVEQRVVEAAVQPATPLAVQVSRKTGGGRRRRRCP